MIGDDGSHNSDNGQRYKKLQNRRLYNSEVEINYMTLMNYQRHMRLQRYVGFKKIFDLTLYCISALFKKKTKVIFITWTQTIIRLKANRNQTVRRFDLNVHEYNKVTILSALISVNNVYWLMIINTCKETGRSHTRTIMRVHLLVFLEPLCIVFLNSGLVRPRHNWRTCFCVKITRNIRTTNRHTERPNYNRLKKQYRGGVSLEIKLKIIRTSTELDASSCKDMSVKYFVFNTAFYFSRFI